METEKQKHSGFLKALSDIYRGIATARRRAYDRGVKRHFRLPRPVISVGNLTIGGTGKTPVVLYLSQKLSGWARLAILSRGYGRKSPRSYLTINDPRHLDSSACEIFGDEPVMLAHNLPDNVSIHVGPKRHKLGLMALERGPVDLFVLDDGLQHMELLRDIDIILLDGQVDPRLLETLPAGPLREPPEILNRADIVWINHCNEDGSHAIEESWLHDTAPDAIIVKSRAVPDDIFTLDSEIPLERDRLPEGKLAAFCGIGKPESFYNTLAAAGISIGYRQSFPDHYQYTRKDIVRLQQCAADHGCRALITTEKDAVRIDQYMKLDMTVYILKLRLEILEGEEAMWERIGEAIRLE